ncbi:SH3 and cysteine-rich domain-containing protein isoform X3 [Hippoglossus hippoglossus]|uniref:SH3 and cysteine-rich domain-containing protein isoform X3 n=1 Tax=Hippoglossus hippoglossus TaxID=8267 RepID=UPI00148C9C02|nr:SH3 and cysteine-rich domain-containing protein isoform X3 [Hippoglossus hippoglossus]XP_035024117.1 SH3 and cysteine-rich domain-containing protein isoform X3 [Hippoglossus stenolepis]
MIPPANMAQDESGDKEDEQEQNETQKSPKSANPSQQETKLQRLKRSLSFKTKSIRSKSADNFFRTSNDNKTELLADVSSSTGHLCNIGMAPPHAAHLPIPPVPPAIPSAPPPTSRSQLRNPLLVDSAGHCFMEHIFKKPTFCDVCNHMIVGTTAKHVVFLAGNTAKHGLRCKACKMSLHHKCENGVGQQRCMGKLPKGFRRYYSSPLLIQEQYGCIKEVMPIACGNKVDPVYEALRFGTSLAQKAKRPSGSESPHRNSNSDLDKVPEEVVAHSSRQELSRKHSDDVFTVIENGTEHYHQPERKPDDFQLEQSQLQKDILKLNTYVALFSFIPQESHDLEMRAGDKILLADDSNDDWWKGVIEDRIGFFPAAFAHQVRAEDQVFRCNRTFIGCKEQGQITLKEGQICVSSEGEHSGFLRVESGKKRGFVPCDVLEII